MNYEKLKCLLQNMNYEHLCLQCKNYEMSIEHTNYENRKISVCNKWIMKKL